MTSGTSKAFPLIGVGVAWVLGRLTGAHARAALKAELDLLHRLEELGLDSEIARESRRQAFEMAKSIYGQFEIDRRIARARKALIGAVVVSGLSAAAALYLMYRHMLWWSIPGVLVAGYSAIQGRMALTDLLRDRRTSTAVRPMLEEEHEKTEAQLRMVKSLRR